MDVLVSVLVVFMYNVYVLCTYPEILLKENRTEGFAKLYSISRGALSIRSILSIYPILLLSVGKQSTFLN